MHIDEQGRLDPDPRGDEATTLVQFLDWQRETLVWKTAGLDDAALRRTLAPSTMTLGGLLGHLAYVEDYWLSYLYLGADAAPRWRQHDWTADPDADWHLDLPGDELRALWRASTDASRAIVDRTLADGGLDTPSVRSRDRGPVSLRWVLVHLIEVRPSQRPRRPRPRVDRRPARRVTAPPGRGVGGSGTGQRPSEMSTICARGTTLTRARPCAAPSCSS